MTSPPVHQRLERPEPGRVLPGLPPGRPLPHPLPARGRRVQAGPAAAARHHRPCRGLRPQPRRARRALLRLGDRLHRPRLLHQARPPAGDPALRRPGHRVLDTIGAEKAPLLRRIPRWLGHRPLRHRPPRAGRTDRAEHHGRHHGQPQGHGTALHPVHGGGEGPVLGTRQGPPGMADGRPDHGHRRPHPHQAGHLRAAGLDQGLRDEHGATGPGDAQAQHDQRRRPASHTSRGAGRVDHQGPLRSGRRGPADRVPDPERAARGHRELRSLAAVRGHRDIQPDPPRHFLLGRINATRAAKRA